MIKVGDICHQCGTGKIVICSGPGRIRKYKGKPGYIVPDDFEYRVCDFCKTEYMYSSEIIALGNIFESQIK